MRTQVSADLQHLETSLGHHEDRNIHADATSPVRSPDDRLHQNGHGVLPVTTCITMDMKFTCITIIYGHGVHMYHYMYMEFTCITMDMEFTCITMGMEFYL